MNRVFSPSTFFKLPDGTSLAPFLNSKDSMSELPFDLVDGFSVAMGKIDAQSESSIHIHRHVVVVTFILSGKLVCKMKGINDVQPYETMLSINQATLTNIHKYLQLINGYDEDCQKLIYYWKLRLGNVR